MERRLLSTLSEKMTDLIQNAITASMHRVMFNPSPAVVVTAREMFAHKPSTHKRQYLTTPNPDPSPRSATFDFFDRPDRSVSRQFYIQSRGTYKKDFKWKFQHIM